MTTRFCTSSSVSEPLLFYKTCRSFFSQSLIFRKCEGPAVAWKVIIYSCKQYINRYFILYTYHTQHLSHVHMRSTARLTFGFHMTFYSLENEPKTNDYTYKPYINYFSVIAVLYSITTPITPLVADSWSWIRHFLADSFPWACRARCCMISDHILM